GKTMIACSHDLLHCYDLATGKDIAGFPKKQPKAWETLTVSPDGRLLAAADHDTETVAVWELPSCKLLHMLPVFNDKGDNFWFRPGLAFSRDGKRLFAATGWKLSEWNLTTGKLTRQFQHNQEQRFPLPTVAFSVGGDYLTTASIRAKTVSLWDGATGKRLHEF